MTKEEILDEWLRGADTSNLKEGHYWLILQAMEEYAEYKDVQNEWIDVNDRLPDYVGACLVYNEGFFVIACFHVDNFVDETMTIIKPTHWQPLPKQPKKN